MLPNLSALRLAPTTAGHAEKRPRTEGPEPPDAPPDEAPDAQGPADEVFSTEDLVAIILPLIASRDRRKADACRAAMHACSVNRAARTVCAAFPSVWKAWSESVFASPDADIRQRLLGEGLIYRTVYDPGEPLESFTAMCTMSAVAEVASKLFLLRMLGNEIDNTWYKWYDSAYEDSGMDEREWDATTNEQRWAMARRAYPKIGAYELNHRKVAAELTESGLKPAFDTQAARSTVFRDLLNHVFEEVLRFWSSVPDRVYTADEFLDVATRIGDVLGTYIVCVTELETEDWNAKQEEKASAPPMDEVDEMDEMDDVEFERKVVEQLRTSHPDTSEEDLDTLVRLGDVSGILRYGDSYEWEVEPRSRRIFLMDLKRRMAVAVDHLSEGDEELSDEAYSKGLDSVSSETRLYEAIMEYKYSTTHFVAEDLAQWEPDPY